jgi:thioredoxin-related protein
MKFLPRLNTMLILVCVLCAGRVFAASERIEPAKNLQMDARHATDAGVPLIVLVSLADCPHCETVKRSHLLPLLSSSQTKPVFIRQIELKGSDSLIGFNGEKMTHAEFARLNKAAIAPVIFFFGARGESVAEPLIGAMIPDFYGAHFDAALATAKARIRTAKAATTP